MIYTSLLHSWDSEVATALEAERVKGKLALLRLLSVTRVVNNGMLVSDQ